MKNPPNIYTDDKGTWVCFGSGSIVVANATEGDDQVSVWMGDTFKSHKIGVDSGISDWNREIQGRSVILGFNKVESIDVVVETLMQARAALVELQAKILAKEEKWENQGTDQQISP